ncbi:hypothetical protein N0V90_008392 [Kalmusia sp. IMI 367209]|nr:hypothetical protein N0V90_008392 [Kalmusia sp. IMI 367209]
MIKVWKTITNIEIPQSTVKKQFEHLKLYGKEAFPSTFGKVFSTPLDDPEDRYLSIRANIEDAAHSIGIKLSRRKREEVIRSGGAAKAKALSTRQAFKKLKLKACYSNESIYKDVAYMNPQSLNNFAIRLGGVAIQASYKDECLVDSFYDPIKPMESGLLEAGSPGPRCLGYRNGFVPPLRPTAESINMMKLLTNAHLDPASRTSFYCSITTSLIQAMKYALEKDIDTTRIAIIALDHPTLQEDYKSLEASYWLSLLKREQHANWAYRGSTERLIWANIPPPAILKTFPLSDLITMAEKPIFKNILAFETIKPSRPTQATLSPPRKSTRSIAQHLKNRNMTMTAHVARTIGEFARTFGLDSPGIKLNYISDFVAGFVDSYGIADPQMDIHTQSSISSAFAVALCSKTIHVQDLMGAFVRGFQEGRKNLERFSHRRRRT